jgi:hypothetical protein
MRTTSRISGTHALLLSALTLGAAVSGCGDEDENPGGKRATENPQACVSTREYFTTQIYGKTMQTCLGCHTPGGTADQKGAKFKLYRETWPDFVSANLESIKDYAKLEIDDTPVLLLKPLGERDHGGGQVFKEDSEDFKTFQSFIQTLRSGEEKKCDADGQLGVEILTHRETARKAAVVLAGRYPTDEEFASATTDEGLDAFVVKLTNDELFYDRLREIWNDALLTERPLGAEVGQSFYNAPQLYDTLVPGYNPDIRRMTSNAVTEEPMRFVEYVVRNNLPFSDVVTGNYIVANPFTAKTYGLPHESPLTPDAYLDWRRIDFSPVQNRRALGAPQTAPLQTNALPVAGILSTPAFLTRWETTPTNRGRKRARIVLKNFLATDIFKFAQRPVDSTALTSVQNPTLNSPMCNVCHTVIDPIAGGFRGFNENQLLTFDADDGWHDDMLPPGINSVDMPPQSYGNGLMWLGAQIAKDRRFGIAVAQVMYKGLIGDEPIAFPQDKAAADYTDRVRAYNIQNDWFVKTGDEFIANKFDLRKLVAAIVRSVYFRAKSGDPTKDGLHEGLGQGRLLTPEMLGRKYRATTGLYFVNVNSDLAVKDERRMKDGYLRNDMITDPNWRLTYGGIDSGDTTRRADTISPIMLATSQYTASMVACRTTSFDFTKPPEQRRLFRTVELATTPLTRPSKDAPPVPNYDNEKKIRETIVHLYFRLLGETVDANSEDVNKMVGLFADTWKDLEEFEHANPNKGGKVLNGNCTTNNDWDGPVRFEPDANQNIRPVYVALRDRPDGAAYETGMKITNDENFTIRSWQAVMTFLLTDYRFTHE